MSDHQIKNGQGPLDEDTALKAILEGTASETGDRFFEALVKCLAETLDTDGAWVTEFREDIYSLKAISFWFGNNFLKDYEYAIANTPCEVVVKEKRLTHYPDNLQTLFPRDPDLKPMNAVSYMGFPLQDQEGKILGHLAVLDSKPMPHRPRLEQLFRIFAARAGAELRRMKAEAAVAEREAKLSRIINSAMDAIIDLDDRLNITGLNEAAERVLRCDANGSGVKTFSRMLAEESAAKIKRLTDELRNGSGGRSYLWIPGGLKVVPCEGDPFPAEASLSRYDLDGRGFFTLILRNINDQIKTEQRLQRWQDRAEYLREDLEWLQNFGDAVGESESWQEVLRQISQVSRTDASVLINGETGTGKELVARAIHTSSQRKSAPLITVNCAAIPENLIESELFGHEKGAFTGATQKRTGRFALADKGTIFLDEIGELPIDLQSKLLRVLQEGEFQPVGSSETSKVDVRVIAATNRDLPAEIKAGRFREDLFYRLNVFPILVPPLRERGDDVVLLAEEFLRRLSAKTGRQYSPLTPDCQRRLRSYPWPGNVRELQNIVERAAITAQNGQLQFARCLPSSSEPNPSAVEPDRQSGQPLTIEEFHAFERQNIIRALDLTGWRVAGAEGAASILGVPPSTLSSRMKALGIKRPG